MNSPSPHPGLQTSFLFLCLFLILSSTSCFLSPDLFIPVPGAPSFLHRSLPAPTLGRFLPLILLINCCYGHYDSLICDSVVAEGKLVAGDSGLSVINHPPLDNIDNQQQQQQKSIKRGNTENKRHEKPMNTRAVPADSMLTCSNHPQ